MHSVFFDIDSYDDEYRQFQRDVYLLIEGTLHAGKQYLGKECEAELAKIKEIMGKTSDPEHYQHLEDEHGDVLLTTIDQERFLRNMALVALASRLTHALRNMSKSAESFSPRTKRYEKITHLSEFKRLWLEYGERFRIDFIAHADRIAFIEPMREVRNQIVHAGAEAQTFKYRDDINWNTASPDFMDTEFANAYPDYVSEDGSEVNVTEQQLKDAIEASAKLVGWLASELRTRELVHFTPEGTTPQ